MIDDNDDKFGSGKESADLGATDRPAEDLRRDTRPPSDALAPPRGGAADLQAYIGRQLRAAYDDVAKQPIPDRFVELMKKLDAKDRS